MSRLNEELRLEIVTAKIQSDVWKGEWSFLYGTWVQIEAECKSMELAQFCKGQLDQQKS